jgi:integrase
MPRMPKQFVAPCLNTFRVKDSNSTYARTKVPAYLKAAAPDLKQTVNWGKLTPETKPEVEANHTQLVYRLRLLDAQLREGIEPAPVAPQRAAPADLPASVTELVERFIEREMNMLGVAKDLQVGRKRDHTKANMKLKLAEVVVQHGTLPVGDFSARHLEEIRERFMNHGTVASGEKPTTRYGRMILNEIRRAFAFAVLMDWVPASKEQQLKKVQMIRNDRRAAPPRTQRIPSNDEVERFCSLMDENDPIRGVIEFMMNTGCRVAQALRMRWSDITKHPTQSGWMIYTAPVEDGCSFSKGNRVCINPKVWMELQRFHTREGKLVPDSFPVFDASTRKGGPVSVKAGTHYKMDSLYNACKRHAERHGLERISPNSMRKRAARNFADLGGIEAAREGLGHRDQQQTAQYLGHVDDIPQSLLKHYEATA